MKLSKTKKITVRFSKRLKAEMQHAIVDSNYGLHGKSRWLAEAIKNFLTQPNYLDWVEHGVSVNQADLTEVEAFYLHEETLKTIKQSLFDIRVKYPLFEGVQSALIRACIIYRLMLKK